MEKFRDRPRKKFRVSLIAQIKCNCHNSGLQDQRHDTTPRHVFLLLIAVSQSQTAAERVLGNGAEKIMLGLFNLQKNGIFPELL